MYSPNQLPKDINFDFKGINQSKYKTPKELNFQQPSVLVLANNKRINETDFQQPIQLSYRNAINEFDFREVSFVLPERSRKENRAEYVTNFQTPVFRANEDIVEVSYGIDFKKPEFKDKKIERVAYAGVGS